MKCKLTQAGETKYPCVDDKGIVHAKLVIRMKIQNVIFFAWRASEEASQQQKDVATYFIYYLSLQRPRS